MPYLNLKKQLKYILPILLLAILFSSLFMGDKASQMITEFLRGITVSPYAPIIYVVLYITGVIIALPSMAITAIATPIFGFWNGLILVLIGANIGSQITFFLSRHLGEGFVGKYIKTNTFTHKLSTGLEHKGFLVILLVRIFPIIPYNILNYTAGLTKVKHSDYTIATLFGTLPGKTIVAYFSYRTHHIFDISSDIVVIIAISLILLWILIAIFQKRKS
jgi:uncharacterized membrane protein YdjX (TVP38/TMEM64 family)